MRFSRAIFSFLIISFIFFGKTHLLSVTFHSKVTGNETVIDYKVIKNYADNSDDESRSVKRKYKSRGVEVNVPHIPALSFRQFYTYKEFRVSESRNSGFSFLYFIPLKRGPPCT